MKDFAGMHKLKKAKEFKLFCQSSADERIIFAYFNYCDNTSNDYCTQNDCLH